MDRAKEATCPGCHNVFNVLLEGAQGWNVKPHQMCMACNRANYRKKHQPHQTPEVHVSDSEPISQIIAFQIKSAQFPKDPQRCYQNWKKTTHVTITKPTAVWLETWKWARLQYHPRVPNTISLLLTWKDRQWHRQLAGHLWRSIFNSRHWCTFWIVVTDRLPSIQLLLRQTPPQKS